MQESNRCPKIWMSVKENGHNLKKCQNLPTSVGKKLRRCRIPGQNWSSVHAARLSRSALTRASCSGDALPAQLLSPCSCNQLNTDLRNSCWAPHPSMTFKPQTQACHCIPILGLRCNNCQELPSTPVPSLGRCKCWCLTWQWYEQTHDAF